MQPISDLPPDYTLQREIDLSKDKRLALLLSLGALILLPLFIWLFASLALRLRPELRGLSWEIDRLSQLGVVVVGLLALIVVQMIVHELLHGLGFWLFTQHRPHYAFKGLYAYAAAPDWYLLRNQHIAVGLAPIVGMTLIGLLLLVVVPINWVPPLLVLLTLNGAGSIGDLVVVGWMVPQPRTALVRDSGDAVAIYTRQS